MTEEQERKAFEAHMRSLNATTHFGRQSCAVGGEYRTITVERAWNLWQARASLAKPQPVGGALTTIEAWVKGVRDDVLYPLANMRIGDEVSELAEGYGQESVAVLATLSAPVAQPTGIDWEAEYHGAEAVLTEIRTAMNASGRWKLGDELVSSIRALIAVAQPGAAEAVETQPGSPHFDGADAWNAAPTAAAEPAMTPSAKWGRLYTMANAVTALIGYRGQIDSDADEIASLMDALHDLDGGEWMPGLTPSAAPAQAAAVPCPRGHLWNDFGSLGGRNVSWCPRCDTLAFTGQEPAAQAAAVPEDFRYLQSKLMSILHSVNIWETTGINGADKVRMYVRDLQDEYAAAEAPKAQAAAVPEAVARLGKTIERNRKVTPAGGKCAVIVGLDDLEALYRLAAPAQPAPEPAAAIFAPDANERLEELSRRVYLVATGETHEGQETYTRHDNFPPPMCDSERLYTHPKPAADAVDEELLDMATKAVAAYEDRFESIKGGYNGPIDTEMRELAATIDRLAAPEAGAGGGK